MDSYSDSAKFFDSFAKAFDTIYDGKRNSLMQWVDRSFRSDMFIRFALTYQAFEVLSRKTVLDIGCGSGPYVLEALKRGASHVTAVDPASNMLTLASRRVGEARLSEKCSFIEASFPGITLQPHDHAIVMGVMDYVADAAAFLSALKPLVKISAVISFPSKHWFRTPFRTFRYRLRRCPVYFYDENQIRNLCSVAGFKKITIQKIPGAGMDYHVCVIP